jgi:hypothetical protein
MVCTLTKSLAASATTGKDLAAALAADAGLAAAPAAVLAVALLFTRCHWNAPPPAISASTNNIQGNFDFIRLFYQVQGASAHAAKPR